MNTEGQIMGNGLFKLPNNANNYINSYPLKTTIIITLTQISGSIK